MVCIKRIAMKIERRMHERPVPKSKSSKANEPLSKNLPTFKSQKTNLKTDCKERCEKGRKEREMTQMILTICMV